MGSLRKISDRHLSWRQHSMEQFLTTKRGKAMRRWIFLLLRFVLFASFVAKFVLSFLVASGASVTFSRY